MGRKPTSLHHREYGQACHVQDKDEASYNIDHLSVIITACSVSFNPYHTKTEGQFRKAFIVVNNPNCTPQGYVAAVMAKMDNE